MPQDYWHHWEDVVAGFLLALTVAFFCYRQQYKSLLGSKSGDLALEMNEFGKEVLLLSMLDEGCTAAAGLRFQLQTEPPLDIVCDLMKHPLKTWSA